MAKLAIKGHNIRGNEVIKILEMLGGENLYNKSCSNDSLFYYISDEDRICELPISESYRDFVLFTLEEFIEKHPYEVGDEVFITKRNKKAIIDKVVWCHDTVTYWLKYDGFIEGNWTAEHLQPYKEQTMEEKDEKSANHVFDTEIISFDIAQRDKYELDLQGKFHVVLREGKYYVEKIKPRYPKTFIEVLNFWHPDRHIEDDYQRYYKKDLIEKFQDLLYARDAYWKIAGEEMGLGKPWKPDWTKADKRKYCIVNTEGNIVKWVQKNYK